MIKINDEVISACQDAADYCVFQGFQNNFDDVAEAAITAYLNSIWTKFDADDESTWPYPKIIKGEKLWIVSAGDKPWSITMARFSDGEWQGFGGKIIKYCDPADIMPEENK